MELAKAAPIHPAPGDTLDDDKVDDDKVKGKNKSKSRVQKELSAAEIHRNKLQETCAHPHFKRHGNVHGSFATCLTCQARRGWVGAGWKLDGSCSKSSLPLPSSSTTVDSSIPTPPSCQPEHLSLQGSRAKKICAPKVNPLQALGYQPVPASHEEWCHQIETPFHDIFSSGPRSQVGGDARP